MTKPPKFRACYLRSGHGSVLLLQQRDACVLHVCEYVMFSHNGHIQSIQN